MAFDPFDPLSFKQAVASDAALSAVRREISNILSSYVGWFDPFGELVQNALDAVDARRVYEDTAAGGTGSSDFKPTIRIDVDLDANTLTVTDNGIGLSESEFQQFLAPNFSFKDLEKGNRGHKGVGATYVAYGFNFMRISTRAPGFERSGRIVNAKNWLLSPGSAENPKVEPDPEGVVDAFNGIDRGVSISVRFDETTTPGKLSWLKAETASTWMKLLSIKTGIGSVEPDDKKTVTINVTSNGKVTTATRTGTSYPWLHQQSGKSARLRDIDSKATELFNKNGDTNRMPDKFKKLDFIHEQWTTEEFTAALTGKLDSEDKEVLEKYTPTVAVEYGYTAKFWSRFNDSLGIRVGQDVLKSGIQLAANNMPQGEVIQVPLVRNIGRQNQVHFLFHFSNYTPDLGRKGFHRELTEFAKRSARTIIEGPLSKHRKQLRQNTGASPDLQREIAISEWKKQLLQHEVDSPLTLSSPNFFVPTNSVSITSTPTREQDVIALFHALLAGGVIRGISIMSTNEHSTYDGLFKVSFGLQDKELYRYAVDTNPLGVSDEVLDLLHGKVTDPRVLEYKFSLDGLIEDFGNQDKNINDIDLCIAWETGQEYASRYNITSLLHPDNTDQRQFHGVTHVLEDVETGNKHCELIILSELIERLNFPEQSIETQTEKYE